MKQSFKCLLKLPLDHVSSPVLHQHFPLHLRFWLLSLTLGGGEDFYVCQLALLGGEIWHGNNCTFKGNATRPLFTGFFSMTSVSLKLNLPLTKAKTMRAYQEFSVSYEKECIIWLWHNSKFRLNLKRIDLLFHIPES